MKSLKYSLLFFISLFCFTYISFAQENNLKGLELCDSFYELLQKSELNPEKINFFDQKNENFPYNIVITNEAPSDETLFLIFSLEEIYEYKSILFSLCYFLEQNQINSKILLSCGDNPPVFIQNTISGTQVFVQTIASTENCYGLVINFDRSKNNFQTGTMGHSSPSWMIKNAFDAYSSERLTEHLPIYLLSQLSSFNFGNNRQLGSLLSSQIPSISMSFAKIEDEEDGIEQICRVIETFLLNFKNENKKTNDIHFIMFNIFGHRLWISEFRIVQIIIIIIFMSLVFIFSMSFINTNIHNIFWSQIRKIWYILPLTLLLSTAGFFTGRVFYSLFRQSFVVNNSPFTFTIIQLCFSIFFTGLYYCFELLFRSSYQERSIDYLIVISTFINQFLFALVDISLYPLFMLVCIFSIGLLIFKKNWQQIIFTVLMILPFITYASRLYNYSESITLQIYLLRNNLLPLCLSCVLLPYYLYIFRILTFIKKKTDKKFLPPLLLLGTQIIIIVALLSINSIWFTKLKTNTLARPQEIQDETNAITVKYSDQKIFTELFRTIEINSENNPDYITLSIESSEENPVLYSDYEFSSDSKNRASFIIPVNPPKNLQFTYGTTNQSSTINVRAYYRNIDNTYSYISKSISTEGK